MIITKRNYILGDSEAISDQNIGSFTINTWSYIKLDGFFKFLFSDPVLKVASTEAVISFSDYELLEDTRYTSKEAEDGGTSKTIYAQIKITNASYTGIDLLISCNNFGSYTDNEAVFEIQSDVFPIGAILKTATYDTDEMLPRGWLPYAFDNKVSESSYPRLFAKIGSIYEAQHVASGDSASGSGYFYPTPIPGDHDRVALPDITYASTDRSGNALINITHHISRDGTPVMLIGDDIPAPLVSGTVYYVKVNSATSISFSTTEDNAKTGTVITLTDAGTGSFRLTQEGVRVGHAFQGHRFYVLNVDPATAINRYGFKTEESPGIRVQTGSPTTTTAAAYTNDTPVEDTRGNGTPSTSNETRVDATYSYGWVKAI